MIGCLINFSICHFNFSSPDCLAPHDIEIKGCPKWECCKKGEDQGCNAESPEARHGHGGLRIERLQVIQMHDALHATVGCDSLEDCEVPQGVVPSGVRLQVIEQSFQISAADIAAGSANREPSKCLRKCHYDCENDDCIGNALYEKHGHEDVRCPAGRLLRVSIASRPSKYLRKRHHDSEDALVVTECIQAVDCDKLMIASLATDVPCKGPLHTLGRYFGIRHEKSH